MTATAIRAPAYQQILVFLFVTICLLPGRCHDSDCKNTTQLQEYIARVCDCNTPSRNCNPYCPKTYIACGKGNKVKRNVVVKCKRGKIFDPTRKTCVDRDHVKYPCPAVAGNILSITPADICSSSDCFCVDKTTGVYPNPYDNFCMSFIQCNSNGRYLTNLVRVGLCGNGQRFDPSSRKCAPATKVPCGAASVDSCSDPVCFCTNRLPGIYDNPFDFEANSVLECGTCGVFLGMYFGAPGFFYNGQDFVKPTPQNPKPQLCGQATGGIKASTDRIARLVFAPNSGRRLTSEPNSELNSELNSDSNDLDWAATLDTLVDDLGPDPVETVDDLDLEPLDMDGQGPFRTAGRPPFPSGPGSMDTTDVDGVDDAFRLFMGDSGAPGLGFGIEYAGVGALGDEVDLGLSYPAAGIHDGLAGTSGHFVNSTCGRSVLATAPRGGKLVIPASSCNKSLAKYCKGIKNAYRRYGCYMIHCVNQCALTASTRNLCKLALARRRPPPPKRTG